MLAANVDLDTETAITAAIARLAPGALRDTRETALYADGYRAGRNESPAPDAPAVITGRDAEIWTKAYLDARPRRPDDWPGLPPGTTARMVQTYDSAPMPDVPRRCYSNPVSARAAGGIWLPPPHKMRDCAECGIPLTSAYAIHVGMLKWLCRLCRARRPGLSAIPRRPCAGCGAIKAHTRLYQDVCGPACARAVGVYADVLPPPGAYYAAVKCDNWETCGTLVIINAPRAARYCAACAARPLDDA